MRCFWCISTVPRRFICACLLDWLAAVHNLAEPPFSVSLSFALSLCCMSAGIFHHMVPSVSSQQSGANLLGPGALSSQQRHLDTNPKAGASFLAFGPSQHNRTQTVLHAPSPPALALPPPPPLLNAVLRRPVPTFLPASRAPPVLKATVVPLHLLPVSGRHICFLHLIRFLPALRCALSPAPATSAPSRQRRFGWGFDVLEDSGYAGVLHDLTDPWQSPQIGHVRCRRVGGGGRFKIDYY